MANNITPESILAIEYLDILNTANKSPECQGTPPPSSIVWWVVITVLLGLLLLVILAVGIYCIINNRRSQSNSSTDKWTLTCFRWKWSWIKIPKDLWYSFNEEKYRLIKDNFLITMFAIFISIAMNTSPKVMQRFKNDVYLKPTKNHLSCFILLKFFINFSMLWSIQNTNSNNPNPAGKNNG